MNCVPVGEIGLDGRGEVGVYPAGKDGVTGKRGYHPLLDLVLRPGDGEALGKLDHPTLAGGVRRDPVAPEDGRHGADVDDLTCTGLNHVGVDLSRAQERAGEIDVDDLAPLVSRVVLGSLADADAGVVYEDVDSASVAGGHHDACAGARHPLCDAEAYATVAASDDCVRSNSCTGTCNS